MGILELPASFLERFRTAFTRLGLIPLLEHGWSEERIVDQFWQRVHTDWEHLSDIEFHREILKASALVRFVRIQGEYEKASEDVKETLSRELVGRVLAVQLNTDRVGNPFDPLTWDLYARLSRYSESVLLVAMKYLVAILYKQEGGDPHSP